MKTLHKLFYPLLLVLLVTVLIGCGGAAQESGTGGDTPTTQPPVDTTVEDPVAEEPTTEEPTMEEPTGDGEAVTLRYANWNLGTEEENNIQRQMVQAYMDAHPNVTVEFVDMSAEGGWDAVLTTYAARGELPDVFMANNVPLYVQNGWVADLTEFVQADADWENVPPVLQDAVTYDGQVLGLPAAQFVMGYFVNKDLYEENNLDAPEYGFSVEEFEDAVTSMHDASQGRLGLDEFEFVMGWYANTQDPDLKWFSYDGEQLHYNSTAFKDAVAFAGEMRPYTWQGLTEDQVGNFRSVGPWELFINQEVGMRWDGAWAVPSYVETADFEWDFVGIPGGNQAMVADVMVVSNTAANPQAAYEFAKWMTFSKEAYAVEAELAEAMGSAPKMPVSLDDESLALYQEFVDVPGIAAALDNLDNSMVESLAKIVPGYINARWEGKPGISIGDEADVNMGYIFANAHTGAYNYVDYAPQLEEFANGILDDADAQMNQ